MSLLRGSAISAQVAARRVQVHPTTLREALAKGLCAGEKIDKNWWTTEEAATLWKKEHYRLADSTLLLAPKPNKSWTNVEIQILKELKEQGLSGAAIAKKLLRSEGAIRTQWSKIKDTTDSNILQKIHPQTASEGDWLPDLRLGIVQVGGVTDTPIPWPYTTLGKEKILILTKSMQESLQKESLASISYLWGIDTQKAQHYRSLARREREKVWDNYETLAILKMHVAGSDTQYIANILGWSVLDVETRLKKVHEGSLKQYTPSKKNKPHSIDWAKYNDLLGAAPSLVLAQLIGCRETTVINRRRSKGIPPYTCIHINWSDWDHLLGTIPDAQVAQKIGCTPQTVCHRRKQKGVDAYRKSQRTNWPDHDHLLGTMPDKKLAEKIGCGVRSIYRRRIYLGIGPNSINWSDWDDLLGTMSDGRLAKKIGCGAQSVYLRRRELGIDPKLRINWSEHDHLLGTMTDKKLAEKIGCCEQSVRNRRRKLGIEAKHKKNVDCVEWTVWDYLIGTISDIEIARLIGCDPSIVTKRRKQLGIKGYNLERMEK